ncbi:MAG: hypothetical protein KKA16_01740 [Alphaproteobacteria bacterium]|nr:hypothetical protein [Alphaproteobacteria bacterium]MBU2380392.1 hypothetical protein [Alphaproteobacteria bacterium]
MSGFRRDAKFANRPVADIQQEGNHARMRWRAIQLYGLLAISGCASVPQAQTAAICPTDQLIGISITISGKLSSDGIHGIFLRPDACPASYFMLNEAVGAIGFEKVTAAVYGAERIGTLDKVIHVMVVGSVEGNPLSIRVTEVRSVDYLSAATRVR